MLDCACCLISCKLFPHTYTHTRRRRQVNSAPLPIRLFCLHVKHTFGLSRFAKGVYNFLRRIWQIDTESILSCFKRLLRFRYRFRFRYWFRFGYLLIAVWTKYWFLILMQFHFTNLHTKFWLLRDFETAHTQFNLCVWLFFFGFVWPSHTMKIDKREAAAGSGARGRLAPLALDARRQQSIS